MIEGYVPQAGDIGSLSTGTVSGFFIQLGERSKADHVVIADGKGGIYEATPRGGTCHSSLERYKDRKIAWDKHRFKTPEQRALGIAAAEALLHRKYFWRAIVVIGFHLVGFDIPSWARGDMSDHHGLICSEYGALVLRAMGFEFYGNEPAWRITPSDHEEDTLFL